MSKRELQSGIIAGVLWIWRIIVTLDPYRLQFYVRNMSALPSMMKLDLIGSTAPVCLLILGLLMNQRIVVGAGCLTAIGFNALRLTRITHLASAFTGSRGLTTISWLAEALCFLILLLLLGRPEEPKAKILTASALALAGQVSHVLGPGYARVMTNSALIVPGVFMYVLAVIATGMYCAGLKPEMLNEFFRKNRAAGSSGNGYGNSMNSHRRGASAEEDFRSVRGTGTVSDEKRERIRKLKELRDSGVMTKEEYDQMVDRIKRS